MGSYIHILLSLHILKISQICSENRYLLFLTENYAALDILKHYIRGKRRDGTEATDLEGTIPSTHSLKPFTLFGSSFPKDKEYTQVR